MNASAINPSADRKSTKSIGQVGIIVSTIACLAMGAGLFLVGAIRSYSSAKITANGNYYYLSEFMRTGKTHEFTDVVFFALRSGFLLASLAVVLYFIAVGICLAIHFATRQG
jgi:hypothetical protein